MTFLALAMVGLAVAPAQAKEGGKTFDVAVLQCIGDGAEVIVDAVSVTPADLVIPLGTKCAAAVKAIEDAGFELDSAISRPVTFTLTYTKKSK
jgi:hypothetical protein